jgi:hypothetical protein
VFLVAGALTLAAALVAALMLPTGRPGGSPRPM